MSIVQREGCKETPKEDPPIVRSFLCYTGCVLALLMISVGCTANLPTERFYFREDFEETDPVRVSPSASPSTYQVNFKGLTSEHKASGQRSFKLDLTFTQDATITWRIPMPRRVPAEGRLHFSGKLFVDPATTARLPDAIRTAPMYDFPPSTVAGSSSGTTASFYRPQVKGRWLAWEQDIVENARMANHFAQFDWGDPDITNVGAYMTLYFVTMVGKKGDRIVIYLDDITIEGEVPTLAAYQQEMEERWKPVWAKVERRLQTWESRLAALESQLAEIHVEDADTAPLEAAAADLITKLERVILQARHRGALRNTAAHEFDADIARLESMIPNLHYLAKHGVPQRLIVTTLPPISSRPVLPRTTDELRDLSGVISDTLGVTATPGEYEPASFVVYALSDIHDLEVRVGDLKNGTNTISRSQIDVKTVKRWYQAGSAWTGIGQNKSKRVLVPELLLNDDTLVKVDHQTKENYLKLSFPAETRYVWISNPQGVSVSTILSCDSYPVKDSPTLLPVSIASGDDKQFWLTVHVPNEAPAGTYTGPIELYAGTERLAELQLEVCVLPFKLSDPYYTSSLYYRGMLDPTGRGSVSSEVKSETQMRKELENMYAHGVTNPRVRLQTRPWDQGMDLADLERVLQIRQAVGMGGQDLHLGYGYNLNFDTSIPVTPQRLGYLRYRVSEQLLPLTRRYGVPEVYMYGIDEARGEQLVAQKEAWKAIQEAGAKIEVSGYRGHFELVGDVLDLLICAGRPNKAEADLWHGAGRRIWNYANPQAGVEDPEVYRRNFGLLLWKHEYDGACTWTYHMSFGSIWNDFDHPTYRDHNLTYPTIDGVIDTIAWEGYREGVDDVRYLTTLTEYIEKAYALDNSTATEAARVAEAYLAELKEDLEQRDLYAVRIEIIEQILQLKQYL
jgi:hypothetical protein